VTTELLLASPSPTILEFLAPKILYFLSTLAPDAAADAFLSLVSAGTCELLTTLFLRPESYTLNTQYGILTALETHALNTASPTFLPMLMVFSTIAATDSMFTYIEEGVWEQSWQSTYPSPDLAVTSKPLADPTARPVAAVLFRTRPTPGVACWPFYGLFDHKYVRFGLMVVGLDWPN
jgi:hypothetical protein